MADDNVQHDNTTVVRENDEVESFSGGEIKSVEPTHEELHSYAGGEIVERSQTPIPRGLWQFWVFVLVVVIVVIVVWGALPNGFLHVGSINSYRPDMMGNAGYEKAELMMAGATNASGASPYTIDLYRLPLPAGESLKTAIANGTQTYQTNCVGCHGPNQDGAGPNSVSLDPKPRNLRNQDFMQAISYQRIWTSIHKGVPGTAMPRWENTLSDKQIQEVIAYVFSLTAPQNTVTNVPLHVPQSLLSSQAATPSSPPNVAVASPTGPKPAASPKAGM